MVRRALTVALLAVAGAALVALGIPACPTATFFGVPCPGCGLTRATLAALHGDVGAALRHHPLVFVLSPLVAVLLTGVAVSYVRGPRSRPPSSPERARRGTTVANVAGGALLALLLGVWLARFFGYFGGPEPVRSISALLSTR